MKTVLIGIHDPDEDAVLHTTDKIKDCIDSICGGPFTFTVSTTKELEKVCRSKTFNLYIVEARAIASDVNRTLSYLPQQKVIVLCADGILSENHLKPLNIPHTIGTLLLRETIVKLKPDVTRIINLN